MSEAKFWLRVAALAALSGFLAFALVLRVSVKGGSVKMPDLKGMTQQAAAVKLHNLGLDMQVREERYSDAPYGAVLEQSLEPDAVLKRGRTIAVVVSIGNKVLAVPSVVGVPSSRQARLLLEQNGLALGRTATIYAADPADTVLAQSPEPGSQAMRGEGVSLLISGGPAPVQRLMPDLRGRSLDDARTLVTRVGLVLRRVSETAQAGDAVPGSVVDQSLTPSTRVDAGTELYLSVAPGGSAQVPARLATLEVSLPEDGVQERRLKVQVKDSLGQRVVYNRMEQPGANVSMDVKVHGPASAEISIGGEVVETRVIP
ncbi:MAG TPA: PASTA domain-containing protein [bacterium]|nr:PASTA domain-containing protein [bacterium]